MSFGLSIWSSNRTLEFDTSISTYRIVLSVLVSYASGPGGTRTFSVLGCNANNSICFFLPINNDTSQVTSNRQLECEMAQDVVYTRNFLKGSPSDSFSNATMRLIVARFG